MIIANRLRWGFSQQFYYEFFPILPHPPFMSSVYRTKAQKLFSRPESQQTFDQTNIVDFYSNNTKPRKQFILFGRSNVGKSSLINSLLRSPLTEVSKAPGKTQRLHSFKLSPQVYLIDSPGFGFTSGVQKKKVDSWKRLIQLYLQHGSSRKALCLIDSQHGLKESDKALLGYLDKMKKEYLVVFTKCDKGTQGMGGKEGLEKMKGKYGLMHPVVHFTSVKTGEGMEELRSNIACIMDQLTAF